MKIDLKTRVMQLELLQLENNVLLSRVPESAWETVDQCRDKIIEALVMDNLLKQLTGMSKCSSSSTNH